MIPFQYSVKTNKINYSRLETAMGGGGGRGESHNNKNNNNNIGFLLISTCTWFLITQVTIQETTGVI